MQIVLASASPRRKELLSIITPSFIVAPSETDESIVKASSPMELVLLLARAKCFETAKVYNNSIVIGCDTVVEIDGEVLGKPINMEHAVSMLGKLSGRMHLVHTGICIKKADITSDFCETTKVYFNEINGEDLQAYVKTNEPYDKAGGYGIQAWAAKYIHKIDGCFFNVMGLPISRLNTELLKFT